MKLQPGPTVADEIPPVHVLEAAQSQDRKETEDLLAGFDRPDRGPKKPSAERDRDFVDYYAKKKGGRDSGRGPSSGPAPVLGPRAADVATVVKPRKTRGMPAWLAWAGPGLVMLSLGGVVAYFALGSEGRPTAGPRIGPGAATTITAATTAIPASRDLVPPPAPADPTTTTPITVTEPPPPTATDAPPRPGRREPRGVPSAGAASTATGSASTTTAPSADRKPAPRDDFIRDL